MDSFNPYLRYPIVYVLALENDSYYCGITFDIHQRMAQHFGGFGAKWTVANKPLRIEKIIWPGTKALEKSETLRLFKEYGASRVRGSNWCSMATPNLKSTDFADE
jgi:predicted GIY-YIG superfamily endonuclease